MQAFGRGIDTAGPGSAQTQGGREILVPLRKLGYCDRLAVHQQRAQTASGPMGVKLKDERDLPVRDTRNHSHQTEGPPAAEASALPHPERLVTNATNSQVVRGHRNHGLSPADTEERTVGCVFLLAESPGPARCRVEELVGREGRKNCGRPSQDSDPHILERDTS